MKKILLLAAAMVLVGPMSVTTRSQKPKTDPDKSKAFMQLKLMHMQKVLEGVTTEKFELVRHHANQMILASHETQWHVIRTPAYREHSSDFRRAAASLVKAAGRKNVDAAALGYLDTTMKCVTCHKYVRSLKRRPSGVAP